MEAENEKDETATDNGMSVYVGYIRSLTVTYRSLSL